MSARLLEHFQILRANPTIPRALQLTTQHGAREATQLNAAETGPLRFLKLGRVEHERRPTVFVQEILQARTLFPPVL